MEPLNPFSYFVNENEKKTFTFPRRVDGKLFLIIGESKNYVPISVIVNAWDELDAKTLLGLAFSFGIECCNEYNKNKRTQTFIDKTDLINSLKQFQDCLEGKSQEIDFSIKEVNHNQFFKISVT